MIKEILVPKDRMRVFISVKKRLQDRLSIDISVESNVVSMNGESLSIMEAETVVKAIARGFSPAKAFELLNEENTLIILDLPSERNKLIKTKSRLIGTDGKCRKNMEQMTGTFVSVYGKTVSIIGEYDSAEKCRRAMQMLIKGSPHKNVYKFLESLDNEGSWWQSQQKNSQQK